jgi:hypothetical protein
MKWTSGFSRNSLIAYARRRLGLNGGPINNAGYFFRFDVNAAGRTELAGNRESPGI